MTGTTRTLPILAGMALVVMLGVSSWISPGTIVPLQSDAVTPTPTEDSWVIVDLPADATQLEYGTEVYRLVCKACHGDRGQGLTDDWRAQWAPKDQNCWQSKCHALNHPPDGFYMPMSPPVVGPPLVMFETALDLYEYNRQFMPWHDPGNMTESEYWSVTAYILKINGVDPGPILNAKTAAAIPLRGNRAESPQSPAAGTAVSPPHEVPQEPAESPPAPGAWTVAIVAGVAPLLVAAYALFRRTTR